MGIAASRSSVALLLLRIVVAKWHTRLLTAVVLVTMISCCVTTVLLFLQCKIMPSDWKQAVSQHHVLYYIIICRVYIPSSSR
jgi:hypothetical protein